MSSVSEFDLISEFFAVPSEAMLPGRPDVLLGIGDDAALVRPTPGKTLVVATDSLVEGIHFPSDLPAGDIGYRALAVNLSDLAAMGATPRWFTLSLTMPESARAWLKDFAGGLMGLAVSADIALIGGDTTRGPLTIGIQVLGEVAPESALRRDGARPGDAVLVSGVPGLAAMGLQNWQRGQRDGPGLERFLRPEPRVALGQFLTGKATAAIDISDGLWADLEHLLRASKTGVQLDVEALPGPSELPGTSRAERQRFALYGGDDYELCFTACPAALSSVREEATRLGIPIHQIGRIVSGEGIVAPGLEAAARPGANDGYRHF